MATSGRSRRLEYEFCALQRFASQRRDLHLHVEKVNSEGLPVAYKVVYDIKSMCGVADVESINDFNTPHPPIFANQFTLLITIPPAYPSVDAQPEYRFIGDTLPWHPNIRYFGPMAGHVCINQPDTHTDIAWGVERIALYLRYELYHAIVEPPYPEDLKVAQWVRHEGEPNDWVFFDQEECKKSILP